MSAQYSLEATATRRGCNDELHVTAELELVEDDRHPHWWFVTRINGKRIGDFERFPFTRSDRPPLDAALYEVRRHISARLGVTPKEVYYRGGLGWRREDSA